MLNLKTRKICLLYVGREHGIFRFMHFFNKTYKYTVINIESYSFI